MRPLLEWKTLKEAFAGERRGTGDPTELKLFIDNDGDLYRKMTVPIMKNLARKIKRDIYDPKKAIKLWLYLATEGAKKYTKEFDSASMRYHELFPKEVRIEVAERLSEEFQDALDSNELNVDVLADYKPKKARKRAH